MTKRSTFGISTAILMLGCLFSAQARAETCPPAQSIRIATQNLWHYPYYFEERLAALKLGLAQGAPQIIAFQEVLHLLGGFSLYEQYLSLTGQKGFDFERVSGGIGRESIALASAFPMRDVHEVVLPHTTSVTKRLLIDGIVESPIGRLRVLATHLNPFDDGGPARQDQVAFIHDYIAKLPKDAPVVLLGDMNASMRSKTFQLLLDLGFQPAGGAQLATWNPANIYVKPEKDDKPMAIDHIFYRPTELVAVRTKLLFVEKPISDHYGLQTELCRVGRR